MTSKKVTSVTSLRQPPPSLGGAVDQWEDHERDLLARHIADALTEPQQRDWLASLYFSDFASDMAVRIKQQPLERQADEFLDNCSREHLREWIEGMGYEQDRAAWRQRLNRARLRRQLNRQAVNA